MRVQFFSFLISSLTLVACLSDDTSSSYQLKDFEGNLRGGLANGEFSLTFDDGPTIHTERILDTLKANQIRATFFVTGKQALKYPEVMKRILDEGHLVANHTFNHPSLPSIPESEVLNEVLETHKIISPYVDRAYFFRAPYGAWRTRIARFLNESGLDFYVGNIFWDIGGVLTEKYAADWNCWSKGISVYDCGNRYLNEFRDRKGGIVLMHDVTAKTARLVEYLVPKLHKMEYRFPRLDEVKKYRDKLEQYRM